METILLSRRALIQMLPFLLGNFDVANKVVESVLRVNTSSDDDHIGLCSAIKVVASTIYLI